MSTRTRSWLLGAGVGAAAVAAVNHFLIHTPQREILRNLRFAICAPVREQAAKNNAIGREPLSLSNVGLSELVNLAVITISDRFIFQTKQ
jgi:hypothetical protein